MNKKGIVSAVLAFGMIFCGALASCSSKDEGQKGQSDQGSKAELEGAEGLTCGEKYAGKLSENSYDSADDALTAYIELEIGGGAAVTDSKKESDLTESEIAALSLTDEQRAGLTKAEAYTVTYSTSGGGVAATARSLTSVAASAPAKTRKVYLLVINGKVFYLDPLPATGDDLSKSYYDSVLAFENYANCTIKQTITSTVSVQGMTMSVKIEMTVKIADNKCYQESKTSMLGQDISIYYYMEETESGLQTYQSEDGLTWTKEAYLLGNDGNPITSISDMIIICQYDYSYLKKTDTGFTLQDEYFKEYVDSAIAEYNATASEAGLYYYVVDGVVVKAYGKIAASYTAEGMTGNVKVDTLALVSDFGKTTVSVNIPADDEPAD